MKLQLIIADEESKKTSCYTELEERSLPVKIIFYVLKLATIALGTAIGALIPLAHFVIIPLGIGIFVYVAVTGLRAAPQFHDTQGKMSSLSGYGIDIPEAHYFTALCYGM